MASREQSTRINDALYYIHGNIAESLAAADLAEIAAYSEQHFHRLFKDIVGESVHQYVLRTRMEIAANQLMFDPNSPVIEVAEKCGFASLSSFSRVFKSTFGLAPGQWRRADRQVQKPPYLGNREIAAAYKRLKPIKLDEPELEELPGRHVAYVRHLGYDRSIRLAWQKLQAWTSTEGRSFEAQFGLHHSNPAWVPLKDCRYVACVELEEPLLRRGMVNSLTIPGGLHAVFHFTGVYGELLPMLSKVLEEWLPHSGLKMQTTPAYVRYIKNHFLAEDEKFELDFCLPLSFY